MKRAFLLIFLNLVLSIAAFGQDAISVTAKNKLSIDRPNETISLDWKDLVQLNRDLKPDHLKVTDASTGRTLVSQAVDANADGVPEQLIFQADFRAGEKAKNFNIEETKDKRATAETRTFGRFVPERMDDFAWENDRIAFRTYGKTLEKELVSSGIDVWAKRVDYPIIDKWYKGGDASYHKDNGTGLDFYSVKRSRGCGGAGIWDGKRMHVSRNFMSSRVLANGPIRTSFELKYEPWDVNGVTVSETKRFTIDAGQNFFLVESFYETSGAVNQIAVGIAIHEPEFKTEFDHGADWMSLWETNETNGSLGCAVVADPKMVRSFQDISAGNFDFPHHLAVVAAKPKNTAKYYVGTGWSRAGFADKRSWLDHVSNFSQRSVSPLTVDVAKRKGS